MGPHPTVRWLLIFAVVLTLVNLSKSDQEARALNNIADKIINFTAKIGRQFFYQFNGKKNSVVFSGVSIFSILSRIMSVSSPLIENDIRDALDLHDYTALAVCDFIDRLMEAHLCFHDNSFTMTHQHIMFYDHGLFPNQKLSQSSCFNWHTKAIDFSKEHYVRESVNRWQDMLPPHHEHLYLTRLLQPFTKFLFLDKVAYTPLKDIGYSKFGPIKFKNIDQEVVEVPAMKKVGSFFVAGSENMDFIMIRDDMKGSKYSLVFIFPHSSTNSSRVNMLNTFNTDTFTELLMTSLANNFMINKTVILPELSIDTHLDLKNILGNFCLFSLFSYENPIKQMFEDPHVVEELPYSEFLHFSGVPSSQSKTTDISNEIVITQPFWFIIADRAHGIPAITSLYWGKPS